MEARLSAEAVRGTEFSHPIYDAVRPALARLARDKDWPDAERLNLLARELGAAPRTASGRPVRFAAPRAEEIGRASWRARV